MALLRRPLVTSALGADGRWGCAATQPYRRTIH